MVWFFFLLRKTVALTQVSFVFYSSPVITPYITCREHEIICEGVLIPVY